MNTAVPTRARYALNRGEKRRGDGRIILKILHVVFAERLDNEQLKAYNDFQSVCTQNKKTNGEGHPK